jgi:hypothetical protein
MGLAASEQAGSSFSTQAPSKFTAGPWSIRAQMPEWLYVTAGHTNVAAIKSTGTTASKANAGLIAAAPDMLAALREIETICTESAGDCRKRMGTRVGNSLVAARAAIRKATGAS